MENIFSIPRTNRHSNDRRKNKLNIDPVYKKKTYLRFTKCIYIVICICFSVLAYTYIYI